MKRFLIFAGERYYPCGGVYDLKGSFDSHDEAVDYLLTMNDFDWANVLDTQTGQEYSHSR